jgi:hypothetical protein
MVNFNPLAGIKFPSFSNPFGTKKQSTEDLTENLMEEQETSSVTSEEDSKEPETPRSVTTVEDSKTLETSKPTRTAEAKPPRKYSFFSSGNSTASKKHPSGLQPIKPVKDKFRYEYNQHSRLEITEVYKNEEKLEGQAKTDHINRCVCTYVHRVCTYVHNCFKSADNFFTKPIEDGENTFFGNRHFTRGGLITFTLVTAFIGPLVLGLTRLSNCYYYGKMTPTEEEIKNIKAKAEEQEDYTTRSLSFQKDVDAAAKKSGGNYNTTFASIFAERAGRYYQNQISTLALDGDTQGVENKIAELNDLLQRLTTPIRFSSTLTHFDLVNKLDEEQPGIKFAYEFLGKTQSDKDTLYPLMSKALTEAILTTLNVDYSAKAIIQAAEKNIQEIKKTISGYEMRVEAAVQALQAPFEESFAKKDASAITNAISRETTNLLSDAKGAVSYFLKEKIEAIEKEKDLDPTKKLSKINETASKYKSLNLEGKVKQDLINRLAPTCVEALERSPERVTLGADKLKAAINSSKGVLSITSSEKQEKLLLDLETEVTKRKGDLETAKKNLAQGEEKLSKMPQTTGTEIAERARFAQTVQGLIQKRSECKALLEAKQKELESAEKALETTLDEHMLIMQQTISSGQLVDDAANEFIKEVNTVRELAGLEHQNLKEFMDSFSLDNPDLIDKAIKAQIDQVYSSYMQANKLALCSFECVNSCEDKTLKHAVARFQAGFQVGAEEDSRTFVDLSKGKEKVKKVKGVVMAADAFLAPIVNKKEEKKEVQPPSLTNPTAMKENVKPNVAAATAKIPEDVVAKKPTALQANGATFNMGTSATVGRGKVKATVGSTAPTNSTSAPTASTSTKADKSSVSVTDTTSTSSRDSDLDARVEQIEINKTALKGEKKKLEGLEDDLRSLERSWWFVPYYEDNDEAIKLQADIAKSKQAISEIEKSLESLKNTKKKK